MKLELPSGVEVKLKFDEKTKLVINNSLKEKNNVRNYRKKDRNDQYI